MLILDWVRYHEHLKGTKIGCREGDCGACTILVGELVGDRLRYRSATSCLTALGNVGGKHVVTIEGLNPERTGREGAVGLLLNPLQRALCEEGGSQCGFCTPGFIVSMAGFCLADGQSSHENALAAVDGNICRCTGYKSIERALTRVVDLMREKKEEEEGIPFLVARGVLPAWFMTIRQQLMALAAEPNGISRTAGHSYPGHNGIAPPHAVPAPGPQFLGGGTDLYVQRHETMAAADIHFLFDREDMRAVAQKGHSCLIGGAATVTDLLESTVIQKGFPQFGRYARLISSTPIRNIATIAGNFVNASPIGDLSVFFLAMDAQLLLTDGHSTRQLPLREFFLGYKVLHKRPEEWISQIIFDLPETDERINFEKVSKRTHLDIASVNTAIRIRVGDDRIEDAHLAAGGVGPIPAYLAKTSAALRGQRLDESLVLRAVRMAHTEIQPISDARGSADYKSLLLGQLIKAHFLTLFPDLRADQLLQP